MSFIGPPPARFENKGSWTANVFYSRGSIATYNGRVYLASKAIPARTTFNITDGWIPIGTAPDVF